MSTSVMILNALKTLAGRSVRGIRDNIPQGYVLGRAGSGSGPVELISIGSLSQGLQNSGLGGAKFANPTATASDVAVNGTAATAMRSDAAPAVQKGSASAFGIVKVDGSSITATNGIIASVGGLLPLLAAELWPFGPAAANSGGGGTSPGTPPTIVQSAGSTTASASITLATAPVSGNLLVALCESSASTIGTGWTSQAANSGGTNFSFIVTKVAGASESATQTPIGGTPTVATIAMWELSGQAASPVIFASATTATASLFASTANAPGIVNAIALAAISTDGSATGTFSAPKNVTQDFLINTGTRFMVSGHSNASIPVAQMLTTMSASQATRGNIILITT